MTRLTKMLMGLAVGAAGMYFFDPRQGKRRRALVRDQWTHLKTQVPKQMEKKVRHLQNQAQGMMHEFQGGLAEGSDRGQMGQSENQSGHMQRDARDPSSVDGQMRGGQEKSPGPGEGGKRAPSRQPNTRQTMDL